ITCRVCVSMLEVYLEDVFDLFSNRKQVTVRKDYLDNSFHVVGAKSIPVRQYKDVEELLQRAEALRTFAATAIHARSSRAHALFQLELYTTFESTDIAPRTAKILLADLAGCERIKLAQTETGIPFEEARNINLSLLSLGSCIEAVTMRKGSSQNIPEFRNSTLTKLLKEYLGGNSVSSIVVTVGPSVRDARLSVQSLRFADRAMKVVTHAKINTVKPITEFDDADGSEDKVREAYNKKKEALHVEFQVQSELQKLQNKITILECQLMNSVDDEVVARLQEEISTYQKSLADADLELQQQRRVLYDSEVMLEEQLKELNTRMQEMIEENEETTENLLAECRKKHTERLEVEQKRHEEEVDVLLKSHEFELERINQLLQDSDTKCAELTTTLFKTKEDLRKTDGLVDEMQMALEELGEASKATETELYGYVEQLRSENSRLSTAIDTLRQQLKESEASVEDRDNRLKEHEESLDTLRQQLKESEASVEDRDNRLKEHETSLDTLRQQLKESEASVEDRDNRLKEHETSLDTLRQQLKESEASVEDRDNRLKEHETSLDTLRQQLKESEASVEDRDNRLKEHETSLDTLRQQLKESEASVEDRDNRLKEHETSLDTLRQQLKESEASVEDRDNRLKEHETSLDTLRQQLKESEASVEDRDNRLKEHETSLDTLRQQLKESEASVEDRDNRLKEHETSLDTLRQQLKESEASVEDRDNRLKEHETSLDTLRQQLKESEASVEDRDNRLKEHEKSLDTLRQQLKESEASVEDRDNRLKEHEKSLDTLRQQLKESEASVEDRDNRLKEHETSLDTLRQQLKESEASVEDRDNRLKEHEESLDTLRQQLKESEASVEDRDNRLKEHEESLDTLRQQLKESEASVEDRDNRLKEHETSLDTLRQQLKESEASVEDRDNRLKEHEESLDTLRQQLKESETTVVVLTADLKQLKEKMFIDQADLKERIAFLEVELKRCEEKGAYYSALVDEMQAELHCANERVAAMSDQVQNMEVRVFDVCGYMFEAFSVKCQDTVSAFASFTKGVTEDLTKGTTERLRLLAEVVELRSSTVARKAATQRRASAVSSLVQSAQEILSKIADEVEDVDNFSDRSAVVASFVNSPKESWGADLSPRFTEESLTC
ncbi:kinesin putative, (fragment), partial [Trypanosoma brucei gambiense DAL972]